MTQFEVHTMEKEQPNIQTPMQALIDAICPLADLDKIQHLLVVGVSGSGKSHLLHGIIQRFLRDNNFHCSKLLLIDTKVIEFCIYDNLPVLLVPVITDPLKVNPALRYLETEISRRFNLFAKSKVKEITSYNNLIAQHDFEKSTLPQIVIIIDEVCDFSEQSILKERIEILSAITLRGYHAGIHIIAATQSKAYSRSLRKLFPSVAQLRNEDTAYSMILSAPYQGSELKIQLPHASWDGLLEA